MHLRPSTLMPALAAGCLQSVFTVNVKHLGTGAFGTHKAFGDARVCRLALRIFQIRFIQNSKSSGGTDTAGHNFFAVYGGTPTLRKIHLLQTFRYKEHSGSVFTPTSAGHADSGMYPLLLLS